MPVADVDYVPSGAALFGTPEVDVTALYVPTPAYIVLGLSQEVRRRPTDGAIVPTIAVSFSVPGLRGLFTIRIDNYAFTHVDVLEYMRERSYLLHALYALPAQLPPYAEARAV